jgi:CheY-like chemotaxis protein
VARPKKTIKTIDDLRSITSKNSAKSILLADDDESVRKFTKTVLESAGYRVIEAVDGEHAVNKFKEHRDCIRLLILDIAMPKKNGRGVYTEILKMEPGMKALFISGYDNDGDELPKDAAVPFIPKPFLVEELLGHVKALLN